VANPPNLPTFEKGAKVSAVFTTNQGEFTAKLFADECPVTVGNFVGLATGQIPWVNPKGETVSEPLYNGTVFHRIIREFMIQGGDPEGTGMGGPGYKFGDEFVSELQHTGPGILSMANSGPNTNGSQFFITEIATPWLDGRHTVFGEVVKGLDNVMKIAGIETGRGDKPVNDVVLEKVTINID
jgi:peptidyl-prolyl cis-trans isomerase A (cyclophilin A)